MAKIRADLEGVVYLRSDGGDTLTLKARDEVPEGYAVGDHLIAEPAEPAEPADGAESKAPAGTASRKSRTQTQG